MYRISRHIICILWLGFSFWLNSQAQPEWTVTTDAYQQTMVFEPEILTTDSAVLLEDGDILGIFFTDERNAVCGGKMTWGINNTVNTVTVYNDALIDSKNYADESIYFKVWKKSRNCILDSVKGIFRTYTDTSVAITASDTLTIFGLSGGKSFNAGYTDIHLCSDQGIILPKTAPEEYKLTYRSNAYPVDETTGEINLTGSFTGNLEIQFASDYCLSSTSQTLAIRPAPDVSLPAEMNVCEGDDVRTVLDQYIVQPSAETDSIWISAISEAIVVPNETFDYSIRLDNNYCQSDLTVRVKRLPKPGFHWEIEDRCDSVRIHFSYDEGNMEWSTGSRQNPIALTSDERIISFTADEQIAVKLTGTNECYSTDTIPVRVRRMEIKTFDAEEVNADCYTSGKINLRDSNVTNSVGEVELMLENLLTGEKVAYDGLLKEGRYRVYAEDGRKCIARWPKELIILKDCLTDNPVFSPNSDGMDDDFFIPYEGLVIIYNKNGRMIHQFQGPAYWDGTDDRGVKLPLGIYLMVTGSEAKTITILR